MDILTLSFVFIDILGSFVHFLYRPMARAEQDRLGLAVAQALLPVPTAG